MGKTTFAASIPGAIFLATEPGTHALSVYEIQIRSWASLIDAMNLLAEGKHDFKTIVIDTIDNAWEFLTADVAERFNKETIGDIPHGKGWAIAKNELRRVLEKMARLPYGIMLVSHSVDREIERKNEPPYTKTMPTLPNSARQVVMALCSYIFLADFEVDIDEKGKKTTRRVLRTKSSVSWDAGDRTGKLPPTLPLDFAELQKAFAKLGGGK